MKRVQSMHAQEQSSCARASQVGRPQHMAAIGPIHSARREQASRNAGMRGLSESVFGAACYRPNGRRVGRQGTAVGQAGRTVVAQARDIDAHHVQERNHVPAFCDRAQHGRSEHVAREDSQRPLPPSAVAVHRVNEPTHTAWGHVIEYGGFRSKLKDKTHDPSDFLILQPALFRLCRLCIALVIVTGSAACVHGWHGTPSS